MPPKTNDAQARDVKPASLGRPGEPPTPRAQAIPPTHHPQKGAPDEVLAPLFALDEGVTKAL